MSDQASTAVTGPREQPLPTAGSQRALLVYAYDDAVRSEQAARALEYWLKANRELGGSPIAVVSRSLSGSLSTRTTGVVHPGHGAARGMRIGILWLGLFAAGAGALAGWAAGSLVVGILSLTRVLQPGSAAFVNDAIAVGSALIFAFFAAIVGGALGALIGWAVGLVDSRTRGFSGTELGRIAARLGPGGSLVAARPTAAAMPLVEGELARLGGTPMAPERPLAGVVSMPSEPAPATGETGAPAALSPGEKAPAATPGPAAATTEASAPGSTERARAGVVRPRTTELDGLPAEDMEHREGDDGDA